MIFSHFLEFLCSACILPVFLGCTLCTYLIRFVYLRGEKTNGSANTMCSILYDQITVSWVTLKSLWSIKSVDGLQSACLDLQD